jgi:hypothetical protein
MAIAIHLLKNRLDFDAGFTFSEGISYCLTSLLTANRQYNKGRVYVKHNNCRLHKNALSLRGLI